MSTQKSHDPDDFQDVPHYVAAMAMSFPRGSEMAAHSHKRAQLVFAVSGVMEVWTTGQTWLIPPHRALWIPSFALHGMQARTQVELRTLFVRVEDLSQPLPAVPTLVYVSSLLRELIVRAVDLPIEEGPVGPAAQIVDLVFNELNFMPAGELYVPRVTDPRLLKIEKILREDSSNSLGIEEWATIANMSSRNLSRKLKSETGLPFAEWRQQIRLTEAVVRLIEGEPITSIALSLGYESTSSFSRMFRRVMGVSPSEFNHPGVAKIG